MGEAELKENKITAVLLQSVVPVMLYYAVNQAIAILGISALGAYLEIESGLSEHQLYLKTGIQMLGMFLAAFSVTSYYKRENMYSGKPGSVREQHSLSIKNVMGIMVLGAGASLGLNFLFSAIGFIQSNENYSQVAARQFSLPLWLAFLFYGILSPWAEELVFRGILYRSLKRIVGEAAAVFGSALMFGAFHGNLVQMVYGTIMGVIMVLVYRRFSTLAAPVLFHGAANTAIYIITYFF